ncbi:MAG: hypothetical protein V1816_24550 [Pseudomonadota bacterium]
MDDYQTKLLEYIFATQVLVLANQLKTDYLSRGGKTQSDFISEAIELLHKKSPQIFEKMEILV